MRGLTGCRSHLAVAYHSAVDLCWRCRGKVSTELPLGWEELVVDSDGLRGHSVVTEARYAQFTSGGEHQMVERLVDWPVHLVVSYHVVPPITSSRLAEQCCLTIVGHA